METGNIRQNLDLSSDFLSDVITKSSLESDFRAMHLGSRSPLPFLVELGVWGSGWNTRLEHQATLTKRLNDQGQNVWCKLKDLQQTPEPQNGVLVREPVKTKIDTADLEVQRHTSSSASSIDCLECPNQCCRD
jgi:hypothetical protein